MVSRSRCFPGVVEQLTHPRLEPLPLALQPLKVPDESIAAAAAVESVVRRCDLLPVGSRGLLYARDRILLGAVRIRRHADSRSSSTTPVGQPLAADQDRRRTFCISLPRAPFKFCRRENWADEAVAALS
jgi:hypothetical protein